MLLLILEDRQNTDFRPVMCHVRLQLEKKNHLEELGGVYTYIRGSHDLGLMKIAMG